MPPNLTRLHLHCQICKLCDCWSNWWFPFIRCVHKKVTIQVCVKMPFNKIVGTRQTIATTFIMGITDCQKLACYWFFLFRFEEKRHHCNDASDNEKQNDKSSNEIHHTCQLKQKSKSHISQTFQIIIWPRTQFKSELGGNSYSRLAFLLFPFLSVFSDEIDQGAYL